MRAVLKSRSLGWLVAAGALGYAFWLHSARPGGQPIETALAPPGNWIAPFAFPETGTATETILRIGDTLPPIKCVDFDGKPVDLEPLFGEKATLVICWATWCSPCMQALPHEAQLARAFDSKGLRVIGVNADNDIPKAQAAISLLGIPWPNIHDPDNSNAPAPGGFIDSLQIKSWPTLLLFDSQRRLVFSSPEMRGRTIVPDTAGTFYAVDALDISLTRLLGPLDGRPFVTPTL